MENIREEDIDRLDLISFERDLNSIDYGLIDIFDRYQEEVINDIIYRFQLKSTLYRDSSKRMREIFNQAKRETIAQVKAYVLEEIRNDGVIFLIFIQTLRNLDELVFNF